jgi:biotin carboxyl carrier protein
MEKLFVINGEEVRVQKFKTQDGVVSFELEGKEFIYKLIHRNGPEMIFDHGEFIKGAVSAPSRDGESMVIAGDREAVISSGTKRLTKVKAQAGSLASPMPGKIFKVLKDVGSEVKKGETILILEAMKMEHSIRSDKDGKVKAIPFKTGELVQGGVVLAEVE